jgi:hypothetical protein
VTVTADTETPRRGRAASLTWVYDRVAAGDVYYQPDVHQYLLYGSTTVVTDTVYRLEAAGLVELHRDDTVTHTDEGEAWAAERAAARKAKKKRPPLPLEPHRALIAELAAQGYNDAAIGKRVGAAHRQVRHARSRWDIPPGAAPGRPNDATTPVGAAA